MEKEPVYSELSTMLAEEIGDHKFSEMVRKYVQPYKELMSYYRCAMMEQLHKMAMDLKNDQIT